MNSNKILKINKIIKEYISREIICLFKEYKNVPIISLTKVNTTKDLKLCKIYLSIYPYSNITLQKIKKNTKLLKNKLANGPCKNMKCTPELIFIYDDSLEKLHNLNTAIKGNSFNPFLKKND